MLLVAQRSFFVTDRERHLPPTYYRERSCLFKSVRTVGGKGECRMDRNFLIRGLLAVGLLLPITTTSCDSDYGGASSISSPPRTLAIHASSDSTARYTPLAVQVSPAAKCTARSSATDSDSSALIYADSQGLIRFSLDTADLPSPGAVGFMFKCVSTDGTALDKYVDIEAATALAHLTSVSQLASARVRPPLTGDPLQWSQIDLIKNGFPPRPPTTAPDAYSDWLKAASTPLRRIDSSDIPHPDVTNTLFTSPTWSGRVLRQPGTTYMWAQGSWTVPAVTRGSYGDARAAFWVGLDGAGNTSTDIIQTGTTGWALYFPGSAIVSYYAWIEWYPATEVSTPLVVNAGDAIYAEVWIGRADGTYDTTGSYGWSYMANLTAGTDWETSVLKPTNANFAGDSVEWMMERPLIGTPPNTAAVPLADFGYAQMNGPVAVDTMGTAHSYLTDQSDQYNMVNLSRPLATGGIYNSNGTSWWLEYNWQGFY